MTNCSNKQNHEKLLQIGSVEMPGCLIIRHPDGDNNSWFCVHCKKKFIEDQDIPTKSPVTIGIIFLVIISLVISLPTEQSERHNIQDSNEWSQPTID